MADTKMYAQVMQQLEALEKSLAEFASKGDAVAIFGAFTPVLPALYAAGRIEVDAYLKVANNFRKVAAKFDSDGRDATEFGEELFVVMRAFNRVKHVFAAITRESASLKELYPEMMGGSPSPQMLG